MTAELSDAFPEPARNPSRPPSMLSLGVIIWSDDINEDPTVIADRSSVTLTRVMATAIHEMIDDPNTYAGAIEFLESNPSPSDWVTPEDVDNWLDALREATPYPAFSFHQIPATGGADGTNHTFVNRQLDRALQDRAHALAGDEGAVREAAPAPPRANPAHGI